MVMMLVILSTAIGTVTGVIATILLMQRKGQYLATRHRPYRAPPASRNGAGISERYGDRGGIA